MKKIEKLQVKMEEVKLIIKVMEIVQLKLKSNRSLYNKIKLVR